MAWDKRYRPLREGETIRRGDECLTDSHLGWQPATHDIGGKAPDPNYTAHRMYRRLRLANDNDTPDNSEFKLCAGCYTIGECREADRCFAVHKAR